MYLHCLRKGVLVAAAITIPWLTTATAQQPDQVLARVDGVEIRQSDLGLAEADIGASIPPGTPESRQEALVSYLIDVTLLSRAAEASKVANGPNFERRLAHARRKVLMDALLEQESRKAATEAAVRGLYDSTVKNLAPEEEIRARHILVESEEKAKEIVAKLKAGADFEQLARENSKDASASQGGDLGYFAKDQTIPEFAEPAFRLKTGEVSGPVKTHLGWHVIKVEERRPRPVPTFEQVRTQITEFIVRKAQTDLVLQLRQNAKIERLTGKDDKPAAPGAPPKN